ncbi:MAG TPA: glycosyltransferase family 2 protein, partial [Thermoanaerobaculia bacterium]|nr:glycosyltransferase family 2 protein [Thermoanaerobaculia bacterium]
AGAGRIAADSQIVFVDDGSRDGTWRIIDELARASSRFAGIRLSRNYGHQNALLAGLMTVDGDAVASLDADLQDDPAALGPMLERLQEGHEIVLGVRRSRGRDGLLKRATARIFYRLARWGNRDLVADHADFRLMSRRAIEELRRFPETNLYLRGLVTLIGLPVATVEYERRTRAAGETKYPLRKMLAFAFDGISSFTTLPLQLISWIGFLTFLGAMTITAWAVFVRLFTGRAIPGWASTVLPLYALGGVQILSVGVLGLYLAKIYNEVKRRPRFIVRETTRSFEREAE